MGPLECRRSFGSDDAGVDELLTHGLVSGYLPEVLSVENVVAAVRDRSVYMWVCPRHCTAAVLVETARVVIARNFCLPILAAQDAKVGVCRFKAGFKQAAVNAAATNEVGNVVIGLCL